jgi:hypothetical protein
LIGSFALILGKAISLILSGKLGLGFLTFNEDGLSFFFFTLLSVLNPRLLGK